MLRQVCLTGAALMLGSVSLAAEIVPPTFAIRPDSCTFVNHEGRTPATLFTSNGVTMVRFTRVKPEKDRDCPTWKDTNWAVCAKPFKVMPGNEFFVHIVAGGDLPDSPSLVELHWMGADGKPQKVVDSLGCEVDAVTIAEFPSGRQDGQDVRVCFKGIVPEGAAFATVRYGVDYPNLGLGQQVVVSCAEYYEHARGSSWQFDDIDAPAVEILTPSPQSDFNAPIRFRIVDRSGVDWSSLEIRLDHQVVPLESFVREGDVFTYSPEKPWAEDSVHSIDIFGKDVNGYEGRDSGFVAFSRRPIRHPRHSVRDDGVLLVDGKPFFPIGFARVKSCSAIGYDLERGVREWKAKGLNCLHTYLIQGWPRLGETNAVEDARRLADACDREGVMLFHEPGPRRPGDGSAERDSIIARNALAFRERPCQWIWGVGDDTSRTETPAQLRRLSKLMRALDPEALLCSFDVSRSPVVPVPYLPWFDVFAVESYPMRGETPEPGEMATAARETGFAWTSLALSGISGRSIIAGPQFFEGWGKWRRTPTKEEVRCLTFINLACRARGLVYYAASAEGYHHSSGRPTYGILDKPEMQRDFFDIVAEIKPIEASLVTRDAKLQPRVKVVSADTGREKNPRSVCFLLKEDGLFISANTLPEAVKAEFTFADGSVIEHVYPRFGVFVRPAAGDAGAAVPDLKRIPDVRILKGDNRTAYRDPAVWYENGTFHLFFTLVETEADKSVFSYVATSESRDLVHWTAPRKLTPRDGTKDYSSPGNVVADGADRVLCFQSYPRPGNRDDGVVRYADKTARLYTMRSRDLRNWSVPRLLKVKGPDVAEKDMGRMIDPYLLRDRQGLWWCFYKQNGASIAKSADLENWTPVGRTDAGENVCVLEADGRYVMFHSPRNGVGRKTSTDLLHWTDEPGLITLGQKDWPWAAGRLTAGAVLDARKIPGVGKYLLFFHGSGPRRESEGDFDRNASIGVAWSDDLVSWLWP